jgi:hypothetical protein
MLHLEHSFVRCRKLDTSENDQKHLLILKRGAREGQRNQYDRLCEN